MYVRILSPILVVVASIILITGCSSGGSGGYNTLYAQALDSDGNPLREVSVLVNGTNTGVLTTDMGTFVLDSSIFTRGIDSVNRISIGEKGVILASKELVPSRTKNLVFQFPKGKGPYGAVTGYVYNDFEATPLIDVKITLFNENLGLFQTGTKESGQFMLNSIPGGHYRISAQKDGYHTGIGMITVQPNGMAYQGLSLQPKSTHRFQEGIMISGYVFNAQTFEPLSNVSVSMTVDTGYIGMPEPWFGDPDTNRPMPDEDIDLHAPPFTGGGGSVPGAPSVPPVRYNPQYQTTETNDSGFFEFDKPAVGYGIYLNYWKEGYLSGNDYFDIYSATDDMIISTELVPLVMTSASGKVLDGAGKPVKGAYVEFIYAGDSPQYFGGGDIPIGMPSDPGWRGFEDAVESYHIMGEGGAPMAPPGFDRDGGTGEFNSLDNPIMQKYRWENQNRREGSGFMGGGFDGFYSELTNDDGEFIFDSLPVGYYYYFVSAYRHESVSGDIELVENETENVFEFTISGIAVGSVEGYVYDEFGMIIADSLVNCVQPRVDPFAYTNDQGYYRIDNVPVGNWIVSAFKYGYITDSIRTFIGENEVVQINLRIKSYIPPQVTTVNFSGRVLDASTGEGIESARMIFTTADNQFFSDATSGIKGFYNVELIATEYNVLIQHPEYRDLYTGFWVDTLYPQYDFTILPVYGGWGGPWGGFIDFPGEPGFVGSSPGSDWDWAASGEEQFRDSLPPEFDPDVIFTRRR